MNRSASARRSASSGNCYVVPEFPPGTPAEGMDSEKLRPMRERQSLQRGLGPLIVVQHAGSAEWPQVLPAPLEVRSLENENRRLMAYVDAIAEKHRNELQEAEQRGAREVETLNRTWSEKLRARQDEFEAAVRSLQEESDELLRRVHALEQQTNIKQLERENEDFRKQLSEMRSSWEALSREKDTRFAEERERLTQQLTSCDRQLSQSMRSMSELEAALRNELREKEKLKAASAEDLQWHTKELQEKLQQADRAAAETAKSRQRLEAQLEAAYRESAALEAQHEQQMNVLRVERDAERQRSAELVSLYTAQINTLHEQLASAMNKNKVLIGELQRSRVNLPSNSVQ